MDSNAILKRADKARGERDRLQMMFDDAIRLTMPGRPRFNHVENDRGDDIFDETGANGVAEFVSRIQAGITPPFSEFMRLEATEDVAPRDRKAVNEDLAQIQAYLFEQVWQSNFAQESAEAFYDMAITTGVMCFEEGDHGKVFHHKAVPITEVCLEKGHDDGIGGIFREAKVFARDIEDRYPNAKIGRDLRSAIEHEQDRELTVVEYSRSVPGRTPAFEHRVVVKEYRDTIVSRDLSGDGSNPFLAFRWQTTAGETWGRGPLLNALAAIRTTNLMVEMILENAAMSIVGIYQTDNEATVNADQISLVPGTILTKEIGTAGLEPVNGATGNFNMKDVVISDQRLNIRKALFNDMLSDPNRTPASATEVAERMADLAHRSAAGFARIFYEFLQPYTRRGLYILEKRGDIVLPVQNGRAIKFRATSPLAQAQHGRDVQMLMQHHMVNATIYGPQAASMMYEAEQLMPWLNKRTGLDERLFKTPQEFMKAMENMAEMAQQAQGMGAE